LARLDRLDAERQTILQRADSLGLLIQQLPDGSDDRVAELLSRAERLGERSQEIELELLIERQRCRSLALQELESLREGPTEEGLERTAILLDLLDQRLGELWGKNWVFVEPDSADGYETLLDKQAYLIDLQEQIGGVDDRLDRRIEQRRREEALRAAGDRFEDEVRFLDEGGRVGAEATVFLRGIPSGEYSGDGMGRNLPSGGGLETTEHAGLEGSDLDLAAAGPLGVLLAARERISEDLDRVAALLRNTGLLIDRYESSSP